MNDGTASLSLLSVCSHNRTRSVMIAAMLQSTLDHRLGSGRVLVTSAGFGPPDLPAIPDAVDAMAARGLDVSGHRSRPVTDEMLEWADLVLTAERDHVARIATMSRLAFDHTMTLPEFIDRSKRLSGWDDAPANVEDWIGRITASRTTRDYLREPIEEIADPTGRPPLEFAAAVARIEHQCAAAADVIAGHLLS